MNTNTLEAPSFAYTPGVNSPNSFVSPKTSDFFANAMPSDVNIIEMQDDAIQDFTKPDFVTLDSKQEEIDIVNSVEIPPTETLDQNPLQDIFQQTQAYSDSTMPEIDLANTEITNPQESPESIDLELQPDTNSTLDSVSAYKPYTEIENTLPESVIDAPIDTNIQIEPVIESKSDAPIEPDLETQPQIQTEVQPQLFTNLDSTIQPLVSNQETQDLDSLQPIDVTSITQKLDQDTALQTKPESFEDLTEQIDYTQITQSLYNVNDILQNVMQIEGSVSLNALTFTGSEVELLTKTNVTQEFLDVINFDVIGATNPNLPTVEVLPQDQSLETILNNQQEKSERVLNQKDQLLELANALSNTQDTNQSSQQLSLAIKASVANAERYLSIPAEITQEIKTLTPNTQVYKDVKNYLTNPQQTTIENIVVALNANNPNLKLNVEIIVLEMISYQYKIELMELVQDFDSSIRISPEATQEEVKYLRSLYLQAMTEIKLESKDKTKPIDFEEIYQRLLNRIERNKDKLPKDFAISFVFNGELYPIINGSQSFIAYQPNKISQDLEIDVLTNTKDFGLYTRQDLLMDSKEGIHSSGVISLGKILTISSETNVNLNKVNILNIQEFYKDIIKDMYNKGLDYNKTLSHVVVLDDVPVTLIENWVTNPYQRVVVREPNEIQMYQQYSKSA